MKMKRSILVLALGMLILALPLCVSAQYRSEVPSIPGLTLGNPSGGTTIFGIDLSKVDFQNSYSMSVSSFGDNTVAMGLLKSSFNYVINPQVSVQGFVGLAHSPFSTFTPFEQKYAGMQGLSMNNIFYGGEITYRPKENLIFQIGISKTPVNPYRQFNHYSYPYMSRGY